MLWKICSPKSLCSCLKLRLVKSREWSCKGAGVGAAWVQSPAPGADRALLEKRGDLGGSPSLAALQPAACVAQEGESSSLNPFSGKEETCPKKNEVA